MYLLKMFNVSLQIEGSSVCTKLKTPTLQHSSSGQDKSHLLQYGIQTLASTPAHDTRPSFLALARLSPRGLQNGTVYSTAGSRKTPPYGKRGTTYNDLQCGRQHRELHGSAQRGLLSSVIPDISQSVREISLLQGPESPRNHSMNGGWGGILTLINLHNLLSQNIQQQNVYFQMDKTLPIFQ